MLSHCVLSISAGGGNYTAYIVACMAGGMFTFADVFNVDDGQRDMPEMGHGYGVDKVIMPTKVVGLVKKVVGGAAGVIHTTVWTEAGDLSS